MVCPGIIVRRLPVGAGQWGAILVECIAMTVTPDKSTTAGKIAELRTFLAETGRPAARERVEALLDAGSFVEIDALARHRSTAFGADKQRPVTDGIVSGHGTIDGRPVCVFAQDSSIFEGQLGETAGEKILKVTELAAKSGTPLVALYDGSGPRVKEGMAALEFFTKIFRLQSQISGVIPQIAVVSGAVTNVQAAAVALSDVVIAVEGTGSVSLQGEAEDGLAHLIVGSDAAANDAVADVLSYLPSNNRAVALPAEFSEVDGSGLDSLIPDSATQTYNVRDVLRGFVDADSLFELQPQHAGNLFTGFARVTGRTVGVVANQPAVAAGVLDIDAVEKAARFIRFCDAFNVPLLSIIDTPGFQTENDVVRRSAKLISAFATAQVGKITLVTRKAQGAAYVAFGAKRLGTDLVLAWPTAEISVADAATIAEQVGKDAESIAEQLINPYAAAERGLVDIVLPPSQTRERVAEGLRLLERKVEDSYSRKHDNMPF